MATGFIENFKRYCGGSGSLAWLLTLTVGASLALWLIGVICHITGFGDAWISRWLALASNPLVAITRPWTLLTYIITHLSPLHLIFNTLWLYWFGLMLSDAGRDRAIVCLFVGGGIAGGIIYLLAAILTSYNPYTYLTGDSAAVLSVMIAVAILMPNRSIRLFLLGEIRLKWIAAICIAITLIGANGAGIPPQAAHFAGLAFGLFAALYYKGVISWRLPQLRSFSQNRRHNVKATLRAIDRSLSDEERLDFLLDKIRISGYDSLSAREKTELNHISSRIDRQTDIK